MIKQEIYLALPHIMKDCEICKLNSEQQYEVKYFKLMYRNGKGNTEITICHNCLRVWLRAHSNKIVTLNWIPNP